MCGVGGTESFLSSFLSGENRWGWWLVEEAHQPLNVLSHCRQEELLAHKLQSPQTQATQPDLILQFGE